MKNTYKLIMLLLFFTTIFSNCKKELKEIGAVQSKIEGIKGKWELTRIIMVDTLATVPEPIEITDYFQSFAKMPGITFDIGNNTYTSDVTGIAYDFFGSAGTWAFDDPQYPKTLTLTASGKAPVVFGLLASIRPIDANLKIQKYKYCDSAMTDFKYAYQLQLERR
ncbi:MAG: DUF5004 domain-containing protein [Bacteroidota bacterium]|nr:DUF5004 domain-containing protein [Bacteroidota bacterium]